MHHASARVSLLCSEIGRGHPFYLDGVVQALRARGRADLVRRRSDVFSVSTGVAHAAWLTVRATYHLAGRGGVIAAVYGRARDRVSYDEPSALLHLLGRDLRRWARPEGIVVVDHPLLVGALGGRPDVWYVHGELVVPPESVVRTAAKIFVPTEQAAGAFVRGGVARTQLVVTGPCVEPALVPRAEDARRDRLQRLQRYATLTVAIFSSGAEPTAHVRALSMAALALARAGHRVLVFVRRGGRLQRAVSSGSSRLEVIPFGGRDQLDRRTAAHFAHLDLVIGPPHERSNWALALGLPLLMVGPDVGTFAPLNRALLAEAGVARALAVSDDPDLPARQVAELHRSGRLQQMVERGTGPRYDGFDRAAAALIAAVDLRG